MTGYAEKPRTGSDAATLADALIQRREVREKGRQRAAAGLTGDTSVQRGPEDAILFGGETLSNVQSAQETTGGLSPFSEKGAPGPRVGRLK